MIVKVKIETFWFSTYSMEMHSLTSSSFIICLWGETFGSRTILFCKEIGTPILEFPFLSGKNKNKTKKQKQKQKQKKNKQ